MNPAKDEPVVASVVSLVTAATGLLVAFGVHVTPEQGFAIAEFVQVSIGVAFLVRSRVTPVGHQKPPVTPAPPSGPPAVPVAPLDPLALSTATGA